jgi:hypothetical protein
MEMKTLVRANWDRAVAVTLVLLGVAVLIVGWIGVSGTGLAAEQNPYLISGGLGGIALIAVGCTLWISADLQDEWRRLDALDERLGELASTPARGAVDPATANGAERRSAARDTQEGARR